VNPESMTLTGMEKSILVFLLSISDWTATKVTGFKNPKNSTVKKLTREVIYDSMKLVVSRL